MSLSFTRSLERPPEADEIAQVFLLRADRGRRVVLELELELGEEVGNDRSPQSGVEIQIVVDERLREPRQVLEVVEELQRRVGRPVHVIRQAQGRVVLARLIRELLVDPGEAYFRVQIECRRLEPLVADTGA